MENDKLVSILLESNRDVSKAVHDMNTSVKVIAERVESLIRSHHDLAISIKELDFRVDDTERKIAKYESQARMVLWAVSFVGTAGFVSIATMIVKAVGQ